MGVFKSPSSLIVAPNRPGRGLISGNSEGKVAVFGVLRAGRVGLADLGLALFTVGVGGTGRSLAEGGGADISVVTGGGTGLSVILVGGGETGSCFRGGWDMENSSWPSWCWKRS